MRANIVTEKGVDGMRLRSPEHEARDVRLTPCFKTAQSASEADFL